MSGFFGAVAQPQFSMDYGIAPSTIAGNITPVAPSIANLRSPSPGVNFDLGTGQFTLGQVGVYSIAATAFILGTINFPSDFQFAFVCPFDNSLAINAFESPEIYTFGTTLYNGIGITRSTICVVTTPNFLAPFSMSIDCPANPGTLFTYTGAITITRIS